MMAATSSFQKQFLVLVSIFGLLLVTASSAYHWRQQSVFKKGFCSRYGYRYPLDLQESVM